MATYCMRTDNSLISIIQVMRTSLQPCVICNTAENTGIHSKVQQNLSKVRTNIPEAFQHYFYNKSTVSKLQLSITFQKFAGHWFYIINSLFLRIASWNWKHQTITWCIYKNYQWSAKFLFLYGPLLNKLMFKYWA